jgi:uncharacterized protein
MRREPTLVTRIAAASCRRPRLAVLLGFLLAAGAVFYTARHFAMTTDPAALISDDLDYRRREMAFEATFPQQFDLIVAVIDGATPELAEQAAAGLANRLSQERALLRSVWRPDGGPFFDREGILLLSLDEVQRAMEQLITAQPFLGALAADPSLRGVMASLSVVLEGVTQGQAKLSDIQSATTALADALEKLEAGQPAFFSWRRLLTGGTDGPRDTRRIVLAQATLDYTALKSGARATEAIREAARDLHLDPAHGIRLGLTGPVQLADEEFATLAEGADLISIVMMLALITILWLAVRSKRHVFAILVSTLIGLVLTAALGLLTFGRFNLISVAFIALFVGLGVDFAIQVSVRCRAERLTHPTLKAALPAALQGVGGALTLAAAAIAAGFLAFLPTSYVGVAELGAIAGMGMIVALALSITFLPALLLLLQPRSMAGEVGYPWLQPVESWLGRNRRAVLVGGGVVALLCLALLPWLRFDFNPLHLRSAKVESMIAIAELIADPDRTPNTARILAPSLAQADALARRLEALPEVARVTTLSSFIPPQQEEKLAAIQDAAMLLGPTLDPPDRRPAPNDAELVRSLTTTAAGLRRAAGNDAQDQAATAARRLAVALERLARGSAEQRAAATRMLVVPLDILLGQLRAMLQAGPITFETLPHDLIDDWIGGDGTALIEVTAAGDGNDNDVLRRFSEAVQALAPEATGTPISIREAGDAIVEAFLQAAVLSALAVTLLLWLVLRRILPVVLALLPVLLSGLLTLATCAALDLPLNFANIIALPLLIGIGVAFNIYFVMAWRSGETHLLQSSLTRAVVFSALATATGFGALWLSQHPGTASMGRLLMIALGWELVVTLVFRPALLARADDEKIGKA